MIDVQQHETVSADSERSFGIVFCVVFAIIGLWPLIHDGDVRLWSLAIAVGFLSVGLLHPGLLKPLNILWFKFGMLIGRVVSPVVMGIIFFATVVPIGLLFRLRRKDLLHLKPDPELSSYWITRDTETSGSMHDQF